MSVSGISSIPSVDPKRDLLAQQQVAAVSDPDRDGDNDKGASAANEARESSSTHKVDVRV